MTRKEFDTKSKNRHVQRLPATTVAVSTLSKPSPAATTFHAQQS